MIILILQGNLLIFICSHFQLVTYGAFLQAKRNKEEVIAKVHIKFPVVNEGNAGWFIRFLVN